MGNTVVKKGRNNLIKVEKNVETATNMYPGRLVKKGTTDYDVVVAGAGDAVIGVLGYEDTAAPFQPADRTTAYSAGDKVAVLHGPGVHVEGTLASGQNVVEGALLTVGANGEWTAATIGTHQVYGIAMESVDASGGAKDIEVALLF